MAEDEAPEESDEKGDAAPEADREEDDHKDVLYLPKADERQLTFRAIAAGCLLGGLISAMNIYFGLKTGWSIGGSLIAAILGYSAFAAIRPKVPYTRLEANITQTTGSGAGTMASAAGLLSSIPALMLIRWEQILESLPKDSVEEHVPIVITVPDLGYVELTLWGLCVAFLGIFFAIPLRRQMVVQERLKFPTGTATAHTLMAMFAEGGDAILKARTLLFVALGAGAFTLLTYFVPQVQMPPTGDIPWPIVQEAVGETAAVSLFAWLAARYFIIYVSPLMYGAGILIGFRVAASLAAGAVVAWLVVGPLVDHWGWVDGPFKDYRTGARGWILWPGVAIMVSDALTSLALSWRTILRTFTGGKKVDGGGDDERRSAAQAPDQQISMKVWAIGMTSATLFCVVIAYAVFDIPWWMTLIAIALSSVLAMIATRSTGETDINPVGGMGKVTQLVFGAVAPGNLVTNLMSAGVSAAGASQSGDMMQDLKTGFMLGASPKRQLVAQLCGVTAGILFCVPIYLLFNAAYRIGTGDQMPAPAAHSWKAMAQLLVEGFDALPMHAEWAILAGLVFGAVFPILGKLFPKAKRFMPSSLAFGIAFIVPAFYSLTMFLGALLFFLWTRRNEKQAKALGFAVASGLIAGEGLMGIVNAVMTLMRMPTLTGD